MTLLYDWYSSKSVYLYDLKTHKCIKTDIDRDGKDFCAVVVTHDEQFMIAFESGYEKDSAAICVMGLDAMKFREERVLLPGPWDARIGRICIINDKLKAECLSSGYVRQNAKEVNFPMDIVGLTSGFVTMETIFQIHGDTLWAIEVMQIIEKCTEMLAP